MIKPKIRKKRCYNCKWSCRTLTDGILHCNLKDAGIVKNDYCDMWKASDFAYYCPVCDYPLERLSYTRLWCKECEIQFIDGAEGLRL